jgi:metal iron transporter
MNRPSRTDEPQKGDGYNQSPNALSNDLTTNEDLNGISNSRELRRGEHLPIQSSGQNSVPDGVQTIDMPPPAHQGGEKAGGGSQEPNGGLLGVQAAGPPSTEANNARHDRGRWSFDRIKQGFITFSRFVGPGFMVAVAYSEWCIPVRANICLFAADDVSS